MSIPKEPRQLMINVMYLVLTALLALNVSAAVFNAFEMVNKSLNRASASLDESNATMPERIATGALKKDEYKVYAERSKTARQYSKEFSDYIEGIVDHLIDQSGNMDGKADEGDYIELNGMKQLIGKRDYSAVTRIMVEEGKGKELEEKIADYKNKFLSLIDEDDKKIFEQSIPLSIDNEAWKHDLMKRKDWADFTFNHMPLTATLPIFSKFKNDAKAAEASVLNYLLNKVGSTTEIILDQYKVVSSPKKTYIIKGDKFETELFLSASASDKVNTGISISVNGRNIPMKDGVAKYVATGTSLGIKKYNAVATVTNPSTHEVSTYKKQYEYEVGERSIAISATKMNVFYIGVPNPVEISASGISSNKMNVGITGGGATIKRNGDGTYTVNATRPTKPSEFAYVTVSAPGIETSKKAFRVKRIPTPTVKLGTKLGGSIGNGAFKVNKGLIPFLEGFDFDAKCNVVGFRLVRSPKRDDPRVEENRGNRFNGKVQGLINMAKPGDRYFFENVKCKCPGDKYARDVNNLSFLIK